MKDEDHRVSSAFAVARGRHGRPLRGRFDRIWSNARPGQVRWLVSWNIQWLLRGRAGDRLRRLYRGEWCHDRDRARSRHGNRGFFRRGDFQRFPRGGESQLQVYWYLLVVNRQTAGRSRFGCVDVRGDAANRKGHLERASRVGALDSLTCSLAAVPVESRQSPIAQRAEQGPVHASTAAPSTA